MTAASYTREDLAFAQQRACDAWGVADCARNRAAELEAAAVRIELLLIAQSCPGVTGFSWSVDYEYDDQGGFFPSTSIHVDGDPAAASDEDLDADDAATEVMASADALAALGDGDDKWEGAVTVEQLLAAMPPDNASGA